MHKEGISPWKSVERNAKKGESAAFAAKVEKQERNNGCKSGALLDRVIVCRYNMTRKNAGSGGISPILAKTYEKGMHEYDLFY